MEAVPQADERDRTERIGADDSAVVEARVLASDSSRVGEEVGDLIADKCRDRILFSHAYDTHQF